MLYTAHLFKSSIGIQQHLSSWMRWGCPIEKALWSLVQVLGPQATVQEELGDGWCRGWGWGFYRSRGSRGWRGGWRPRAGRRRRNRRWPGSWSGGKGTSRLTITSAVPITRTRSSVDTQGKEERCRFEIVMDTGGGSVWSHLTCSHKWWWWWWWWWCRTCSDWIQNESSGDSCLQTIWCQIS